MRAIENGYRLEGKCCETWINKSLKERIDGID
jgi:hypothetical protein